MTETKTCLCNQGYPCLCGSRKESSDPRSHHASNTKAFAHSMRSRNRLPNRLCENNLTIFTNGHRKPCHRLNNAAQTSGIPYKLPFTQNTNELGLLNSHKSMEEGTAGEQGDERLVQRRRLMDSGLTSTSAELYLNTVEANIVYESALLPALPSTHSNIVENTQSHDLYRDMPEDYAAANGDAGSYIQHWQMQNHSPDSLSTQWPFSASTISSTGSLIGQGFPLSPNDDFVLSPDGDQSSNALAERPWSAVDVTGGSTSSVVYTQTGGFPIDAQKYNVTAFPCSSAGQSETNDVHTENIQNLNSTSTGHFSWEDMLEIRQANAYQANRSTASNEDLIPNPSAVTSSVQHLVEPSYADNASLTYRAEGYTQPEMNGYIVPPVQQISVGEACHGLLIPPEDGDSSFDSPVVTDSPVSSNTFFAQCQLAASVDSGLEMWDPIVQSMSSQTAANPVDDRSASPPLEQVNGTDSSTEMPTWIN